MKNLLVRTFLIYVPFLFIFSCVSDEERNKGSLERANKYLKEGKYLSAKMAAKNIKEGSPFYDEATTLIADIEKKKESDKKEQEAIEKREKEEKEKEEREKLTKQLEREIESVDKGIDFDKYKGSIQELTIGIALFNTWATIISNGENSSVKKDKDLAKRLKYKISKIQTKEFPKIRKAYGKLMAKKLWEHDITVTTSGSRNQRINFVGGMFAANKNKKQFQEEIHENLYLYRFDRSNYRWYKGQDEYTYYKISSPSDKEVKTVR